MTVYHAELAWLGDLGICNDVAIAVDGGNITAVETPAPRTPDTVLLRGLTLPGFVNAHSHAFHRALRGKVQTPGDFWAWRGAMYEVAEGLTPETYEELATAVYAEMVLAGFTAVGEFHYLHHDRGGSPYADPNEMAWAVVRAADRAGIRLVLIDACYLRGGFDAEVSGVQRRFSDGTSDVWGDRVSRLSSALAAHPTASLSVAAHSVRAVSSPDLEVIAAVGEDLSLPVHTHLSEQPAENEAALAATGHTPTELLAEAGFIGSTTSVVHGTHLTRADIDVLGGAGVSVVACPTTERDLGDGLGPFMELRDAGAPLAIGSDSHAVIDPFEELRGIELHDRLRLRKRSIHRPQALLAAATSGGAGSLGLAAGVIAPGRLADLTTIQPLEAELDIAATLFSATRSHVTDVIVGGRHTVVAGRHCRE